MNRTARSAGAIRAAAVRRSLSWVFVAAALQLWTAVAAMIELSGVSACQLLLALPTAIVAFFDFWHGLRKPPCRGHGSSIPSNGSEEERLD